MNGRRVSIFIVAALLFVGGWLLVTEWRPEAVEREHFEVERVSLPDTLRLVTWNIGYGGLGEGMDFFYDGGTRTRASKEESEQNLRAIISQLQQLDSVDFILLQEVDFDSKRSYGVDQLRAISAALPSFKYIASALNYNSVFVPIPLREPMGRVKSGVVILSKYPFSESVRWQFPSLPKLPTRLFDLKRAMLAVAIPTLRGDTLWVNNTHNSAFDDGDMRRREIEFIAQNLTPRSITAGDWNSTPPNFAPSASSLQNKYFRPHKLESEDLPEGVSIAADISHPTMRYLDAPYTPTQSITSIVDFAIIGKESTLVECKILNLGFKNSDHNPIIITFLY